MSCYTTNSNDVDHGWRVVVKDSEGDIVLAEVHQDIGFFRPELEEGRACYFALKMTFSHGVKSVILEGDCKPLITKLKR